MASGRMMCTFRFAEKQIVCLILIPIHFILYRFVLLCTSYFSANFSKKRKKCRPFRWHFSVSKKSNYKFRHAGRLLRNGLNFVFLRGKMYIGTSTEQKTKNTKMAWIRCPSHFYNPSVSAKALPPPFTQRRRKSVMFL